MVVDGDEADAIRRKYKLQIVAALQKVSGKTGEVTHNDSLNISRLYQRQQPLHTGAVHIGAGVAIVYDLLNGSHQIRAGREEIPHAEALCGDTEALCGISTCDVTILRGKAVVADHEIGSRFIHSKQPPLSVCDRGVVWRRGQHS